MKKIIYLILVSTLLCLTLSSAVVPQIIRSSGKLRVINSSMQLSGEGLGVNDTIPFNIFTTTNPSTNITTCQWNVDYTKDFEVLLVRNLGSETDVAVLLDGLVSTLNFTKKWEECTNSNYNVKLALANCEEDIGFKVNYTECTNNLNLARTTCEQDKTSKDSTISTQKTELEKLKSQRFFYAIGGASIVLLFFGYKLGWFSKVLTQESKLPRDDRV